MATDKWGAEVRAQDVYTMIGKGREYSPTVCAAHMATTADQYQHSWSNAEILARNWPKPYAEKDIEVRRDSSGRPILDDIAPLGTEGLQWVKGSKEQAEARAQRPAPTALQPHAAYAIFRDAAEGYVQTHAPQAQVLSDFNAAQWLLEVTQGGECARQVYPFNSNVLSNSAIITSTGSAMARICVEHLRNALCRKLGL